MPAAAVALAPLRVLMFDLDMSMAAELDQVLPGHSCTTSHEAMDDAEGCRIRFEAAQADVVFCPANHRFLRDLLATARRLAMPVIVVNRFPDTREWLDAMDAGASDYTAPPFDERQLAWILSSYSTRFPGRSRPF